MAKNPQPHEVVDFAPISYRLAKLMQRSGVRGGHKLEKWARDLGWLNVLVRCRLGSDVSVNVPIGTRSYDATGIDLTIQIHPAPISSSLPNAAVFESRQSTT